ncbi:hypothetical protein M422DRAFT_24807 [Sphaerobolus stellatus SS14]|nr:hypothetical protein M422DRAFT_24807 [Sphaerobolus stellatus SS14]
MAIGDADILELDESTQAIENALKEGMRRFNISRYLIAAACTCLYLDHFLTLKDEVALVWKARASLVKYAFLLFRYTGLASLTLLAYSSSGQAKSIDDKVCQRFIPGLIAGLVITTLISDALAVLHVSGIWKRNLKIFVVLAIVFIVTSVIALGTRIHGLTDLALSRNALLNTCQSSEEKPYLLAIPWAASLVFDAFVLAFMGFNAFTTFRGSARESRVKIAMARDGAWYFLVIFVVRLVNLFLTIWAPFWVFGIAGLSWPVTTITLSRFLFRMRGRQKQAEELEEYQLRSTNRLDVTANTWREEETETPSSSEAY